MKILSNELNELLNIQKKRISDMMHDKTEISNYDSSPKTINLKYVLRGNRSQIPYTVYGGMNVFLNKQPRSISAPIYERSPTDIDFIMKFLNEEKQRSFINPLVKKIQNISLIKDNQARIAISIVQNIEYDWEALKNGIIKGKYPYEVLYTGSGVCAEKAQLLGYILRELGYGVAIFKFKVEKHDALGIKCPKCYSYRNSGYGFVESVGPSIITDSSRNYIDIGKLTSMPEILKISDGDSFDSVSEEYDDAIALGKLEGMGKVLDKYNYERWRSLTNKYGIY